MTLTARYIVKRQRSSSHGDLIWQPSCIVLFAFRKDEPNNIS